MSVDVMVDLGKLPVEQSQDAADALGCPCAGLLQTLGLCHPHVHELTAPRHQANEQLALFVLERRDEAGTFLVACQHVGEVAQRARVQGVGLGQDPEGLGKVTRLAGIDPRNRDAARLQCQDHSLFVAPGGLDDDEINSIGLEPRDQLVPPRSLIAHSQLVRTPAGIKMLLGHVDACVRALRLLRRPTLRIDVHDGQLFGLTGWRETGQCVDRMLRYELKAQGKEWFGAPTAKGTTKDTRGVGPNGPTAAAKRSRSPAHGLARSIQMTN